ncbi:hypothetical protein T439DRAFT_290877 [Meredithblackwellia eburnea MCA 4105]
MGLASTSRLSPKRLRRQSRRRRRGGILAPRRGLFGEITFVFLAALEGFAHLPTWTRSELCGETFTRRYNLRGHQRAHRNEKPFMCSYEGCEKAFARAHDCKRHELLHLGVRRYHCDPCQRDFVRLDALQRHREFRPSSFLFTAWN